MGSFGENLFLTSAKKNGTDQHELTKIMIFVVFFVGRTANASKKTFSTCSLCILVSWCGSILVENSDDRFSIAKTYEPRREKIVFCICENKDTDQLRGNREVDQRLCFRYLNSTIPLLPKSKISSL